MRSSPGPWARKLLAQADRWRCRLHRAVMERVSENPPWPVLLLVALMLFYLHRAITLRGIVWGGDIALYFYPLTVYAVRQLRSLSLPLWTPYIHSGFPLLADGQGGSLYPPNLLLYLTLPPHVAHNYGIALHVLLAGLLFYLFVRRIGLSQTASFCAAVIYIFAGPAIPLHQNVPALASAAWLPALFLIAEELRRTVYLPAVCHAERSEASIPGCQRPLRQAQGRLFAALRARPETTEGVTQVRSSGDQADDRSRRATFKTVTRIVAAGGLVLGLQLLAGFPQMALLSVTGGGLYLLLGVTARPEGLWRRVITAGALWALVSLAGAGLAAVQLLPTLELTHTSVRAGGADFAFASIGSLLPTGLATLVFSHFSFLTGSSSAITVYLGLPAVSLAAAAILVSRPPFSPTGPAAGSRSSSSPRPQEDERRRSAGDNPVFFAALGLVSILLAFGNYTPLFGLLYRLPGFSFFRVPSRFLYLTAFCASVMAGIGLDSLTSLSGSDARPMRMRRWLAWGVGSCVALLMIGTIVGGFLLPWGREPILAFAERFVQARFYGQAYRVQPWQYYADRIASIYAAAEKALDINNPFVLEAMLVGLALLILLSLWRQGQAGPRVLQLSLVALIVVDMLFQHGGYARTHDIEATLSTPHAVEILARDRELFRIYQVLGPEQAAGAVDYDLLPANYNMLFGLSGVGVYSALGSVRYHEFLGELGTVNLAYGVPPVSPQQVLSNLMTLSLLNVKYILSYQVLDDPRLRLVNDAGPLIYENMTVLPRAFVVPRYRVLPEKELLPAMRSGAFDPSQEVLLETEPPPRGQGPARTMQATIAIYEAQQVIVEVETDGHGFLVLSDLYYPGWQARIDGQEATIYPANYIMRAVPVETGHHRVEFTYRPDSFRLGAVITALTLVVVGLWFLVVRHWLRD